MKKLLNSREYKRIIEFIYLTSKSSENIRNTIQIALKSVWGYKNTVFWIADNTGHLSDPQLFGVKNRTIYDYIDNYETYDFLHPKKHLQDLKKQIAFNIKNTTNKNDLRNDFYYKEFIEKYDYVDEMVVNFIHDDELIATLGFLGGKDKKRFKESDIQVFDSIGKVISQRLVQEWNFERVQKQRKILKSELDDSTDSYILIDHTGHIVYLNRSATHMINELSNKLNISRKHELVNYLLVNTINKSGSITIKRDTFEISIKHSDVYYPYSLIKVEKKEKIDGNYLHQFQMLTSRELEVCRLVVEGYTNKEIASELYISVNTVKRHISNIYNKINVNNRGTLIKRYNQFNS